MNSTDYNNMNVVVNLIKEEDININGKKIALKTIDVVIDKTHLGFFYVVLNNKLNNKNIKILVKELIDNIDYIIFEKYRFIGVLKKSEILNEENILNFISLKYTRKYDIELKNIYLELFDLKKDSKEYKEYSYFLEMEFISHGIPDNIKNIFLKRQNKSILDYKSEELNNNIRSYFSNDYSEYIDPYEYEENTRILQKLKTNVKNSLNELENLEEILNSIESITDKIEENNKIIMEIDIIKLKISNLNIFNLKRIKLKNQIKELKNRLYNVDEIVEIEKVKSNLINKEIIKNLTSLIAIQVKLQSEYKVKSKKHNRLIEEYDRVYKDIEDYEQNKIDISNLRDRLDSI